MRYLLLTLVLFANSAQAAAPDCLAEEALRASLPKKKDACPHVNRLVAELQERFTAISRHCKQMRKISGEGAAISRDLRDRLTQKVRDLFDTPSFGVVVVTTMPDECLKDRDAVYKYRQKAVETFRPLVKNLSHLANDGDPLR